MKIGITSGTANGTIAEITAEAAQVERDGFDSYWISQIFSHDALTVLALVGQKVPRIELGTAVVPTYPRHPMMLAQQGHTVNAAIDGRLCLGIGLSHKVVIEGMMGMSFDKPVRHLREYLSILGPLSQTQKVSFAGETLAAHADIAIAGAKPFGIVVAALGEQMLRLTAAMADGTLTWCTGPVTLAKLTVPTIRQEAEKLGRPVPRVIASFPVCVTKDVAGTRERIAKALTIYGQLPSYRAMLDLEGVGSPSEIAICGTASEVVDRISALQEIGVSDFTAVEFGANPDEVAATRAALKSLNK